MKLLIYIFIIVTFLIYNSKSDGHYNCCIYMNPSVPDKYKFCTNCISETKTCPIFNICDSGLNKTAQYLIVDQYWSPTCCMCKYNITNSNI